MSVLKSTNKFSFSNLFKYQHKGHTNYIKEEKNSTKPKFASKIQTNY